MDSVSSLLIARAEVGVGSICHVTSPTYGGYNQWALLFQLFSNSFTPNHGRIWITRYHFIFLRHSIINFH